MLYEGDVRIMTRQPAFTPGKRLIELLNLASNKTFVAQKIKQNKTKYFRTMNSHKPTRMAS